MLLTGALIASGCAATLESSAPEEAQPSEETSQSQEEGPTGEAAEEIELFRTLYCSHYPNVVECMIACGKAGVGCSPSERHPYKTTGSGTLDRCRTALPMACSYIFPNGDRCAFTKLPGMLPICAYSGR